MHHDIIGIEVRSRCACWLTCHRNDATYRSKDWRAVNGLATSSQRCMVWQRQQPETCSSATGAHRLMLTLLASLLIALTNTSDVAAVRHQLLSGSSQPQPRSDATASHDVTQLAALSDDTHDRKLTGIGSPPPRPLPAACHGKCATVAPHKVPPPPSPAPPPPKQLPAACHGKCATVAPHKSPPPPLPAPLPPPRQLPAACHGKCATVAPHKAPPPPPARASPPPPIRTPPAGRSPPNLTRPSPPPPAKKPPPAPRPPPASRPPPPHPPPASKSQPPPPKSPPPPKTNPPLRQPPPTLLPPPPLNDTARLLPGAWILGNATFYGNQYNTVQGSCGYGGLNQTQWPYWNAVALSPLNQFRISGPQQACGECFEVICDPRPPYEGLCGPAPGNTSVVAMVADTCPECVADHLDLQAGVFAAIAPPVSGIIGIQYRQVECMPPGGIRVVVTAFNGPGLYMRVTFQNVLGSGMIQTVLFRGATTQQANARVADVATVPSTSSTAASSMTGSTAAAGAATGSRPAPVGAGQTSSATARRLAADHETIQPMRTATAVAVSAERHAGRGLSAAAGSSSGRRAAGGAGGAAGGGAGRGLQGTASSAGDPAGAGAAFGGVVAVNQYGGAWAVNNAPTFPLDLFIATSTDSITFAGVIPTLPIGGVPVADISFQTDMQFPT